MPSGIDRLIINSPYEKPKNHWKYLPENRSFILEEGRRKAGYVIATEHAKAFDDPGRFIEIPLVNQIRDRIEEWRNYGYPGVTSITKRLIEQWYNTEEREHRLFFCQLEAIETLIWLVEAPDSLKVGIDIPSDGGLFKRICCKMATGSGKTIVMAMLISWQILNKVTYPQDTRFSKNVFIIAPGLTVRNRLGVLNPSNPDNYYQVFSLIPSGLIERLRQGKVLIQNWHALSWDTEEQILKRRSVDKRGPKSDEAYVREVLGDLASARNILIINDEAHHAWRIPAESKEKGISKEDIEEATIWISGLDRVHSARGIISCYDFTATPFAPSGKKTSEEALYTWIVSDFGLNDAIESGLVKTPRVVIRDDGRLTSEIKSRFYHLYMDDEVKTDLNRKAQKEEPLPDIVTTAYYYLGTDWKETAGLWADRNIPVPPVLITVANRTETAARIKYSFDSKHIRIDPLCDPEKTLHIDSKVLEQAESNIAGEIIDLNDGITANDDEESAKPKLSKKQEAELLRKQVDTVGQVGKPGEKIQNVISVGMLSEGWDAKTVTHIMGLRAFSSQLLCEQVVGRGLRRTSYEVNPETGLFEPEYVNIFGVPFTFLPHESTDDGNPLPPAPKVRVEPEAAKRQYAISWPNVERIEHTYTSNLKITPENLRTLNISAYETPTIIELAPILDGKPDVGRISTIDLQKLAEEFRLQKIIFEVTRDILNQIKPAWSGDPNQLLAQLFRIVEQVIYSEIIRIEPIIYQKDELKRRVLLALNMTKIVHHIWSAIRQENTESLDLVFNEERPIRSTGDMNSWYTGKPCERTKKSHINVCVFDSTWEATEAFAFERHPLVEAWVKNDHLGFEIQYVYQGIRRVYRPDFILRLSNGINLVLETKGKDTERDKTKREFLDEWVRAVNIDSRFGTWKWAVSTDPMDVGGIIDEMTQIQ